MSKKILGLDFGTNSLGWAIIIKDDNRQCTLLNKGVEIFQEGVKIEKGVESSKAAERTGYRQLRRRYFRRRVRKINLLRILSENKLCPEISNEALKTWRKNKKYPENDALLDWEMTDEKADKNPYHYRYISLTQKLDLDNIENRYILGRALYHLNQRRGFLSNRKDQTEDEETGKVKTGISDLSKEIQDTGCTYLGEYFYKCYKKGLKIRKHYTARKEHYLAEFRAICDKQDLDADLRKKLEKAIFFQRPLKSQKSTVGTCSFEKDKPRCPSSHPLYEEFRMYAFLNNIKIKTPDDDEMRPLSATEVERILPKFFRKSKPSFDFEDIAKELSIKKNYCYFKDEVKKAFQFNYPMDTRVSGCPVISQLKEIFGDNWLDSIAETYTLAESKTRLQILNDIWHALYFYSDENKLKEFAVNRLQLDDETATKFSKTRIPSDYAALSLKAITKILPYMKNQGLKYSNAVYLANLEAVVPANDWNDCKKQSQLIRDIVSAMDQAEGKLEDTVNGFLITHYHVSTDKLSLLYHPSMIDMYPKVKPNSDGEIFLGSPRLRGVNNPMVMHSLFRTRSLVNKLLADGQIDKNTTINIEFARELNDANKRKAIKDFQRINEAKNIEAKKRIEQTYEEHCHKKISPSDMDILKYRLWEEQKHKCIYTGKEISICDFLGETPKFDIEHTIPRSAGGDSTMMNLTLCDSKFNRYIKKDQIPQQLSDIEDILQRVEMWKNEYKDIEAKIRRIKGIHPSTKEEKDKVIAKRHLLEMQRDYCKGKYQRFTMTSVPEGFSRRQGASIGTINRYSLQYLKSVFPHVYVVKGIATSDFRKIWGIQDPYERKSRDNHIHHCIDAITIACIGQDEYNDLARYYHDEENYRWYGNSKPSFRKPWPTFSEDIDNLQNDVLVYHYTPKYFGKWSKRRINDSMGRKYMSSGDAARASLHNATYYGAIQRDGGTYYVVRKSLDTLDESDVKNIVDDTVRNKVLEAIQKHTKLKDAVEAHDIWMNKANNIPINKVRVFTPTVVNPIDIRRHRDVSRFEYKQTFHVMNDRNYLMAIYEQLAIKANPKRDFIVINNLIAANELKQSNKDNAKNFVPKQNAKGWPMICYLKIGTSVLLYENTPEEIYESNTNGLIRRLYTISGLSSMCVSGHNYGTIVMVHSQEARKSGEFSPKNGAYKASEELRPSIKMLHTQFHALVEGQDFVLTELGEIRFLHR